MKKIKENWNLTELAADIRRILGAGLPIEDWGSAEGVDETTIIEHIERAIAQQKSETELRVGPDVMRFIEKAVLIQTLDMVWKEHLYALDHLRQGIGLRAYGQRDPLNEYKSEAFVLFNFMLDMLKEKVTEMLARADVVEVQPHISRPFQSVFREANNTSSDLDFYQADYPAQSDTASPQEPAAHAVLSYAVDKMDVGKTATPVSIGRNTACPCGSGKKYKYCHGRLV